eukprot:gene7191-11057_t
MNDTNEGCLTQEELASCTEALGNEAVVEDYVVCRLYLFGTQSEWWIDTGLFGPLFLVRQGTVRYFAMVRLDTYEIRFLHEVYFPFEIAAFNTHFYVFETSALGGYVGIRACDGRTEDWVHTLAGVVREHRARVGLNCNAGTACVSLQAAKMTRFDEDDSKPDESTFYHASVTGFTTAPYADENTGSCSQH